MQVPSVLIGMSGGVDSSVAVYLMKQQGFRCTGATMRLIDPDCKGIPSDWPDDTADARAVAERMEIPFHIFDFCDDFRCHVMDQFVNCYECGLTPNPCIVCNRQLKFGKFLDQALSMGYEYVVTGHYARIQKDEQTGRYLLYKAQDLPKDQSYFLYCLNQHQLAHTILPLGSLTKAEVRRIAQEQGFLNARKRDSQDICFIPDGDYRTFLENYTGKHYPNGSFLDQNGTVVGTHTGAVGYTLGQRKGLGLAMGAPVYVCSKNMQDNTVTVGPNEALFHRALRANDLNWMPFPALTAPIRVKAKTRSRMTEQPATIYPEADGSVRVVFDEPQRAMTPGPAVVFYDGDLVVGGGTITSIES